MLLSVENNNLIVDRHWVRTKEIVGKLGVGELEVALVVEFQQGW